MFHSTFLINRQMITDVSQIKVALSSYLSEDGEPITDSFYRLEWYKIGISIPMDVYSEKAPVLQLKPECQLTDCKELESLPDDLTTIRFKIFVAPYKTPNKNEDLESDFLQKWLNKKLAGAATILNYEIGPNNRIYYKKSPDDTTMSQLQTYMIRGQLKCDNPQKLDKIRRSPVGYYPELGCGLLLLE